MQLHVIALKHMFCCALYRQPNLHIDALIELNQMFMADNDDWTKCKDDSWSKVLLTDGKSGKESDIRSPEWLQMVHIIFFSILSQFLFCKFNIKLSILTSGNGMNLRLLASRNLFRLQTGLLRLVILTVQKQVNKLYSCLLESRADTHSI